jgi:D-glycero-alpha-D-manno-heptose-7-phosphate kinase
LKPKTLGGNNLEIRSRAPLRISFAGGGTDIEPYLSEKGGVVLSTTINRYSYGTLIPRTDQEIQVESLDVETFAKFLASQKLDFNISEIRLEGVSE